LYSLISVCVSAGSTLEEAKELAKEALLDHVALLKEMGEEIPAPSTLDTIMEQQFRDSVAFLVNLPSQRIVRVNVTFPEDVLAVIDRQAQNCHLSRSAFLTHAARWYKESINPHTSQPVRKR
jgi:hypothetical protein